LVLALSLIVFRGFSQKAIENNGDTLICFTPEECKFILKELNRKEYLDSVNTYNLQIIGEYKSVVSELKTMLVTKDEQVGLKQSEIDILNNVVDEKNNIINSQTKEIKRQKRQKIIAICLGSVSTFAATCLYIIK
jgi:hypothetical protein